MNKNVSKKNVVDQRIANELLRLGFIEQEKCNLSQYNSARRFSTTVGLGSLVIAYYVAFSNSKTLFVNLKLGLDCDEFSSLIVKLGDGVVDELNLPYAALGWCVGETGATQFDPAPARRGSDFSFSDEMLDEELAVLESRIGVWARDAGRYLLDKPIYDFYRFEACVDFDSNWREMMAILKVLRGEEYVGVQLLHDLVDEAAGRRPHFGEYDSVYFEVHGLERNEEWLGFLERLRSGVEESIKNGAFAEARRFFDESAEANIKTK